MSYQHPGKEKELPNGIVLVSGIPEAEEKIRKAEEANPIKWKVWVISSEWTKVDFIARGLETEESYGEKVRETSLKMILAGARRCENGDWVVENEHSAWFYHPWNWEQPYHGHNKKALEKLVVTDSFPIRVSE